MLLLRNNSPLPLGVGEATAVPHSWMPLDSTSLVTPSGIGWIHVECQDGICFLKGRSFAEFVEQNGSYDVKKPAHRLFQRMCPRRADREGQT